MHWLNDLLGGGVLGSIIAGGLVYMRSRDDNKTDLDKSYPATISTLINEITKLNKERMRYATQSINLQRKVDDLQDTVNEQDKVIKQQTKTIDSLRSQVAKQSEVIDKLNQQISGLSDKIGKLGDLTEEEIKKDDKINH